MESEEDPESSSDDDMASEGGGGILSSIWRSSLNGNGRAVKEMKEMCSGRRRFRVICRDGA